MNQDLHERAMAFVDEARLFEVRGRLEAAREAYESAADLEQRCADEAGPDEPRSREILRVSAVSMWMSAGRWDRAEALAERYLVELLLPGFHRDLYSLLAEARQRLSELRGMAAEPETSATELTAALRKVEEDLDHGKDRLWAIKSAA